MGEDGERIYAVIEVMARVLSEETDLSIDGKLSQRLEAILAEGRRIAWELLAALDAAGWMVVAGPGDVLVLTAEEWEAWRVGNPIGGSWK